MIHAFPIEPTAPSSMGSGTFWNGLADVTDARTSLFSASISNASGHSLLADYAAFGGVQARIGVERS